MIKAITLVSTLLEGHGVFTMVLYVKNRINYFVKKFIFKQQLIEKKIHNYKMLLDADDPGISRTLLFFEKREEDHKYIINRELKEGNVVLDLGANIGYYVLMEAQNIGATGYLYALEPVPSSVELLRKNVLLNNLESRVEVFQMGGSNKTGVEKIFLSKESNLNTFSPKNYSTTSNMTSKKSHFLEVPTTTIPDFMEGKRKLDFIRMDIEGYEVEVFQGIIPALADPEFSPGILFETHRPKYDDREHSMRDVLGKLFAHGYYPKIVVSNDHPKGEFEKRGYKPEQLIVTDGYVRGIYYGVRNEDALDFICDIGFVRAVFLERKAV